ncbi:MAG TPA: cytochrome P450, partial [Polyangiaceae bacterium]|nr:cytochrome P450 [Polyangiaceae bacterium]
MAPRKPSRWYNAGHGMDLRQNLTMDDPCPGPSSAVEVGARCMDQLPGPKGWPLVGSLFQLNAQKLHLVLEDWARRHGSLYVFRVGPRRTLVVSDPELSAEILRSRPQHYRRIGRIETVLTELGIPGVFSAEGAAWRSQRALLTQTLSARRQVDFYPTLHAIIERLMRRWCAAADSGAELDMLAEFKRLTVDVTIRLAFGHDANTIERDHDELERQLQLIFPTINRRLTAALPYWRALRLPADRRVDRNIRNLRIRLAALMAAARERLARDPSRTEAPSDLLEAMLLAKDEAGQPFSEELILGNALQ